MERSLERWLIGGAAAALVLLLFVAILLGFQNTRELYEDDARVAHTHEVITGLEKLIALVRDAESGQRGYLITGEPHYLEPYTAALAAIDTHVASIERKTSDNPRQQARIPELRALLSARLTTLAEVVALRSSGDFDATRRVIQTNRGKLQMEELQSVATQMIAAEQELLQIRSRESEQTYRRAIVSCLLLGAISVLGVTAFMLLLRRHMASREATAREIAEHAERLRTTLGSIGDAVIATDATGRITTLNAVASALTGWTPEQAIGQPLDVVFRIVNEQTRLPVDSPATRALRDGAIVGLANHTVLIAKDGRETPLDDSAAPIRCKEGEIVGCVLVFRDISERRQAERVQEEAERRKDEFLATLAHELRSPLAPLRNALSILQVARDDPQARDRSIGIMERQLGQMVRLVDDLIDLSRIGRSSLELRLEPVDMTSVLSQAIEACQPIAEATRHTITWEPPARPLLLDGDPARLTQVFTNLLHNACKFTPPGGRITLQAEQDGADVVVSVRDDGIGIPRDRLVGIFDLFVQESTSDERTQGGLGIGLTLVKRLVEMHGGSVEARSDGPGT
jgi:PAS domain S-box-containing protein